MESKQLIEEIMQGLIAWYDFTPQCKILFVGEADDPRLAYLRDNSFSVTNCDIRDFADNKDVLGKVSYFDYIVSFTELEKIQDPHCILTLWPKLLNPHGKLLLGMNNRLGLRYFCGERDPYTDYIFDGIENYRRLNIEELDGFSGRMYAKAEINQMLRDTGWDKVRFYSVLPDLENAAFIYAEDYLPNEDLANRLFPIYNSPDPIFLEEEGLYASIIENGMLHAMANAYLIECSNASELSDVLHVTCSTERGRENAFFTITRRSGQVEKRALCLEGYERLRQLADNMEAIKRRGIPVVDGKLEGNRYVMPRIKSDVGQLFLKRLLLSDKDKFLAAMDHFRDLILHSSEIIHPDKGDGEGATLACGYWDMVPLNTFYINGEFVFFDQEFSLSPCPANFILYRMICSFYAGNYQFEKVIPLKSLFERYGLDKCLSKWQQMDRKYLSELRKEKELEGYHKKKWRNDETVNKNRYRMNYSDEKYRSLFVDIFRNADSRKLLIWGAGKFAEKFMAIYKDDYPVYKIIDNQPARWGQKLDGVEIVSPDFLKGLNLNEYKIIICIKNYTPVIKQLEELGATEYSVYNVTREYQRKFKPIIDSSADVDAKPKKYRVGYIAGVFDLFHVGHLNMFKRAKEQCHYLIVGVVSDEGVRKFKKVEPFVPCDERIEMIRSCRFVDQVVKLPLYYADTWDVWKMYHFDVQFSGSDYEHNDDWLKKQAFLREQGADLVFFPYTESTSSTRLKRLIEKKLL